MPATKVSIIIPIYNEVGTAQALLEAVWNQRLPENTAKELVVIESNSTDGTRDVVKRFQHWAEVTGQGEVKVVLQEKARGKGHALREGFLAATGDVFLIQDGDLEYDVADYPQVLQPILDGRADFVLGSRHLSAGSWKIRQFKSSAFKGWLLNLGGIFFHSLFNMTYQTRLSDPTTMYKVFRKKCLERLHFQANRFDFDYELTGKLIRAGYLPLEVPISYRSRGFEEGKKIRIFRDPFTWVVAILRFRFSRLYQ